MTFANRFFLHPTVVQKLFIDGWIVLGIFSLVAWLIVSHKNTKQIKIFTLLYLLFLVATVEEQTIHGWYHYPLFPIFSLSIAWFLDYITINKDYWIIWLSWIFVLPTIRMALVFSHTYNDLSNFALRSIMALGGLPLGLSLLKKQKLAKKYVTFLFLILILASIIAILTINARDYSETNQFFNFKIS